MAENCERCHRPTDSRGCTAGWLHLGSVGPDGERHIDEAYTARAKADCDAARDLWQFAEIARLTTALAAARTAPRWRRLEDEEPPKGRLVVAQPWRLGSPVIARLQGDEWRHRAARWLVTPHDLWLPLTQPPKEASNA